MSSRGFIIVSGKDQPGITAQIARVLAENNINVLDVNQRIVGDTFGISMVVDLSTTALSIPDLRKALIRETAMFQIKINVMHEDIVKAMNRV